MGIEYKSIEVANDDEESAIILYQSFGWRLKSSQRIFSQNSRPVGALTYENSAMIFSRTETVDFTKLLFERDTKMPHHCEIKDLEEEFFELAEATTLEPPLPPKPLMSLEAWVKATKPKLFPTWVILLLLFGICAFLPTTIATLIPEIGPAFIPVCIFSAPIVWLLITVILRILRNRAAVDERALFRDRLQKQYDSYKELREKQIEAINLYDYASVRLKEIMQEVTELLSDTQ